MRAVLIGATLALGWGGAAQAQAPPDEPQPLRCVPPARARELFFEQNLVPPIRAMRQAAGLSGAEAIDIRLCWFRGALVYDVTLLGRDGPVTHRLMSGATGAPLGGPNKP